MNDDLPGRARQIQKWNDDYVHAFETIRRQLIHARHPTWADSQAGLIQTAQDFIVSSEANAIGELPVYDEPLRGKQGRK